MDVSSAATVVVVGSHREPNANISSKGGGAKRETSFSLRDILRASTPRHLCSFMLLSPSGSSRRRSALLDRRPGLGGRRGLMTGCDA
jgi:hypothetical protein